MTPEQLERIRVRASTMLNGLHYKAIDIDRYEYGLPLFEPHEERLIAFLAKEIVELIEDLKENECQN